MIPSFVQRLISIHIMVLLNGRALLHYRRPKQRIFVPEIGLGLHLEIYTWAIQKRLVLRRCLFIIVRGTANEMGGEKRIYPMHTLPKQWPELRSGILTY